MPANFVDVVQIAAQKRVLFLLHALDEMNAPDELISPDEVRAVIFLGEIIEDYPDDPRGHSCLMWALVWTLARFTWYAHRNENF